jgi:hypothetical protein
MNGKYVVIGSKGGAPTHPPRVVTNERTARGRWRRVSTL